ncbi:MAG: NTP transferase domain-containing protein [Fibrobacteria bacterium]|nr:NTP transferase domain-containing protein [Fibrobacteria bacterium]
MSAGIHGLILAGGASRRMGTDKAHLEWRGEGATLRLGRILSRVCSRVFLSRAPGQDVPEGWEESEVIRDLEVASGPLRGILSAFEKHPDAAWLVVAVDQPLVDEALLHRLVEGRGEGVHATCFLDSDGEWPDPTCALYEPTFPEAARPWATQGKGCPRKVLINTPSRVLPSPGAILRDADSPEERLALSSLLGAPMDIVLEHFAMVRDHVGLAREDVTTVAPDLACLWEETRRRLRLPFERTAFRPVRNDAFAAWSDPIRPGDRVAFLPPVSGG